MKSSRIVVSPAATSTLVVKGFPSPVTAGKTGQFTVTAEDAFGNMTPAYTGTVMFTSSDGQANLPANSQLTGGKGRFNATLETAGVQSITATDTTNGSITGSQTGIIVDPADASQLSISALSSVSSGQAFTIIVTALDPYNNVATGFRGTVQFESSDHSAKLPTNFTFTSADAGVHAFTEGISTKPCGYPDHHRAREGQ